ncbi:ABC transporter ATP-binding protein [Ectothiorhodospiraceae bacterium BW-2]|nr:ABC transporter ATP-binding protein [Ectothiorhodospiraceae bacterium BW-2]
MNQPLLALEGLTLAFGYEERKTVVEQISFELQAGERLALVGESGSGKSVTAMSLLQLHDRDSCHYLEGEIYWQGEPLMGASKARLQQLRGKEMAMIFQEPMSALNPLQPVGKQIEESIALHENVSAEQRQQRVVALLERVGLTPAEERLRHYPHQLSGGQRQRVMIAMALACRPKLLIADEPTTALDVTIQLQIMELLQQLQQEQQLAILLITHDLNLVRAFADRVVVMERGRVVEQNRTEALFSGPQHPYTRKLLASEPEPLVSATELPQLQQSPPLLTARAISCHFPLRRGWLNRQVGSFKAVDGIELQLWPGETVGIVGESGSGKTTLGLTLLRLQSGEGEIEFNQQPWHRLSQKRLRGLRHQFQIVFQDPYASLSPRLTVRQIIGEGLTLYGGHLSAKAREAAIAQALEEVGLEVAMADRYPHEFSGGQRQRIAIARALVLKPKAILLDEPTSALDISVQKQVLVLLRQLQLRYQMSYLFISHDLNVVRAIAHRVLVMRHGVVVEQGVTEQVLAHPNHPYTAQLLQAALFKRSATVV